MTPIKEIEFTNTTFIKQKIVFHNNVAVLLGRHYAGKTRILSFLNDGLRGKVHANFFVNNQKVGNGDFQVMYLKDDFHFKDETKLGRTSPFRNQLIRVLNKHLLADAKYQQITSDLQSLASSLEKVITETFSHNLKALTDDNIVLRFDTRHINLEGIVDHLLEVHLFDQHNNLVLEDKNVNRFLLRMVVFNVLKTITDEEDVQRPIIVLFDNPELYTTLTTMHQLNDVLKTLLAKNHFYLVLASSSGEYLADFGCQLESINYLHNNAIQHFTKVDDILQHGLAIHSFLFNRDYHDWLQYQNAFWQIFDKKDLQQERRNFYRYHFLNIFKIFFVDQVVLQESDHKFFQMQTEPDQQLVVGHFYTSLLELIMIYVFCQYFAFPAQYDAKLLEKYPKIQSVLKKTQN